MNWLWIELQFSSCQFSSTFSLNELRVQFSLKLEIRIIVETHSIVCYLPDSGHKNRYIVYQSNLNGLITNFAWYTFQIYFSVRLLFFCAYRGAEDYIGYCTGFIQHLSFILYAVRRASRMVESNGTIALALIWRKFWLKL